MSEIKGMKPTVVTIDEAFDIEIPPGVGVEVRVIDQPAHIRSISLVQDDAGATGFILTTDQPELFTAPVEVITSHADLQNYAHEYNRRIYTVQECKCGRDEFDPIHGDRPHNPSPDEDHSFDRRAFSPFCKCGEPLWAAVHDVIKFEKETNDEH